jgi:hypothetical protein
MEISNKLWELSQELAEELMDTWPNEGSVVMDWLREMGKLPPDPRRKDETKRS